MILRLKHLREFSKHYPIFFPILGFVFQFLFFYNIQKNISILIPDSPVNSCLFTISKKNISILTAQFEHTPLIILVSLIFNSYWFYYFYTIFGFTTSTLFFVSIKALIRNPVSEIGCLYELELGFNSKCVNPKCVSPVSTELKRVTLS